MLQPDPVLWRAIEERRMIRLLYHRRLRIVEPHDHGILNGSVQLLAYQVGGSSRRGGISLNAIPIGSCRAHRGRPPALTRGPGPLPSSARIQPGAQSWEQSD